MGKRRQIFCEGPLSKRKGKGGGSQGRETGRRRGGRDRGEGRRGRRGGSVAEGGVKLLEAG